MRTGRPIVVSILTVAILVNHAVPVSACGPSSIWPIFVFQSSPDLPFNEYVAGKIGIVRESFGRKTLVIAYRYLNNRPFVAAEQAALLEALSGTPPETDSAEALKTWLVARKKVLGDGEETLPEIYTERKNSGTYDFFPNCTSNAFEVARDTLKARVASYGAEDRNVRLWLATQDAVFENCGGGGNVPVELGNESPEWLRKDRQYQIGAALLYSLNFESARAQFEKIAADTDSPWQTVADYLVARTLVRAASFAKQPTQKQSLYEHAERHLRFLTLQGGPFAGAAKKLLGLVEFRVHPKERLRDLAAVLETESGNENVRQDLIDYVWLVNKFESQALKEEEAKRKAQEAKQENSNTSRQTYKPSETYQAIQRGERIDVTLDIKKPDGSPDYSKWVHLDFPYDVSEDQMLQAFEVELNRKLNPDEIGQLQERRVNALETRKSRLSPNRNWAYEDDEIGYTDYDKLTFEQIPEFLRTNDLTDWLFTFENHDRPAYSHAFAKWRATGSPAWLVAALAKATPISKGVELLMRAAQRVDREMPAYASVTYHLLRLQITAGRKAEARKLLDEITSWPSSELPTSAQNQFLDERLELADSLAEFLKFAQRRPAAFFSEWKIGRLSELMASEKLAWNGSYYSETKEDFEESIDNSFRQVMVWDENPWFDKGTVDALNWHFSLQLLSDTAFDHALPDALRRRILFSVWTRAILLKNDAIARKVAAEIITLSPDFTTTFKPYLQASDQKARQHAAIYILLKQPMLSPYLTADLPQTQSTEELDYYFESSWWCSLEQTEYDDKGNEVPKIVNKPRFLSVAQISTAASERAALISSGEGKHYLGEAVLQWAKEAPDDPLMPEALFIAARATAQYKYGCHGWDFDEPLMTKLMELLEVKYPNSEWAAKLSAGQK